MVCGLVLGSGESAYSRLMRVENRNDWKIEGENKKYGKECLSSILDNGLFHDMKGESCVTKW